jgi:hypothetical protein
MKAGDLYLQIPIHSGQVCRVDYSNCGLRSRAGVCVDIIQRRARRVPRVSLVSCDDHCRAFVFRSQVGSPECAINAEAQQTLLIKFLLTVRSKWLLSRSLSLSHIFLPSVCPITHALLLTWASAGVGSTPDLPPSALCSLCQSARPAFAQRSTAPCTR